jgi:hypothetical protein
VFFPERLRKSHNSKILRRLPLIARAESFMNRTAGFAVILFLAFLLLSTFSIAVLFALFTPLLSPFG